ncbi:MAG: hypothetical protein KAI24_17440 [Planctomycetes bacterium]|nr:hypothetical protein [Planctomycetota bacterium]
MSFALTSAAMAAPLSAQSAWACPDDGQTIAVANAGTTDKSYEFKQTARVGYDNSLQIRVVTLDANGDVTEVHTTIPWNFGTNPTIVVQPGRAIQIVDPTDADTRTGLGTYQEV